ncbi:MAG: helix-turn-helix transcriptional regulator [Actinomycetota bacterium]|nr:helix-turn-helix transcriptional regulator [Actinomycetota bacterium]
MSEFRIGEAASVLGVSPDTVRRWVDAGQLASRRTEGGHRLVDGAGLARLARERVGPATEVRGASAQSARNRLPGIVTKVTRDTVMAQVDIQAGPHRVVALLSREAADELDLEPGSRVVAAVKATNVVVETPARA